MSKQLGYEIRFKHFQNLKMNRTMEPAKTKLKQLDHFWKGNATSIWLASTLSLHRNVDKFIFPTRLETSKKKVISDLIVHAIHSSKVLENTSILSYDSMEALEKEYLYEHFLDFSSAKDSMRGESFLFDANGNLLMKLNVQDHLEIHGIDTQGNLELMFEKMQLIERAIEKQIAFSFSNKFGYLTEDPTKCGTGFVVQAFLHVPALVETNELPSFLRNCQAEGVSINGLLGETKEIIGDMIVVKNRWTIGTTEEAILSLIRTTALAIATHEKEMRSKLHTMPKKDSSLFDTMGRVVGTMKFCYTIDTTEALRALSIAKLGIEIGWLEGTNIEELNRQFFELRRAHIASSLGWDKPQEEINHERARRMRALFTPILLHTD